MTSEPRLEHEQRQNSRTDIFMLAALVFTVAFAGAPGAAFAQGLVTNTYSISSADFPNPERGFYIETGCYSSSPSPVQSNLGSMRTNGLLDPGGAYTAKISMIQRLYYLDLFTNSPISASFLNLIQSDFNSLRAQGDKAIVRFAYTSTQPSGTDAPSPDPSKAQILAHIAQVQPLLQSNCDVIAFLQIGFIGTWGEGYYTEVFSTNVGGSYQNTAQNWTDRADVLNAELAALPATRMIQVRYPQIKQKYVYGPAAPITSAAISPAEALSGDYNSRVAFHNDCFVSSANDVGTYNNYDYGVANSSSETIATLRGYLAQETAYAVMSAETCAVYDPDNECSSAGGRADTDLALFHYSALNEAYLDSVDDQWVTGGCMPSIKLQLGYRLQLVSGIFRAEAQPGQEIPLTLVFQNVGYAAPYNPRGLELVLSNTVSGQKYFAQLSRDTDVRRWLPGSNQVLNASLALPADLPLGSYALALNLPDPAPTLYGHVPYSIQLANSNAISGAGTVLGSVWDPATGYNWLGQTLTVNLTATNPAPAAADIPVLSYSGVLSNYNVWDHPVIFAQPAGATNVAGGSAVFSVGVGGLAPLDYQWYTNNAGAPLAGGTNAAYTNALLSLADNGAQYFVVISNAAGAITSSVALLVVTNAAAPTITIQLGGGGVQLAWPGGTLQQAGGPAGPWTAVSNAPSPWLIAPAASRQFYRISIP